MAYRPKSNHERIIHRLKIAQGMMNKVLEMVETRHYCIKIIHQSQAVQEALKDVDNLILENHLKSCVAEQIRKGEDKKTVKEIMSIIQKAKKN